MSKQADPELRRMREEFKRRASENAMRHAERQQEEETQRIVEVAVRAGLLCIGGISLCFSTVLIPGIIPFLGGLLCGVSLVEPPPQLDASRRKLMSPERMDDDSSNSMSRVKPTDSVVKSVLMNIIEHFF